MNTMLTTLRRYWQGLTLREQGLLAVMGTLLGALLVSLVLIQPLLRFHDRSREDYGASMRLYRAVQADAQAYRTLSAQVDAGASDTRSLRAVIGSSALRNEISLARLVPSDDGALTVSIDRAPAMPLMRWLVELDERYGIQVMTATVDREAEGYVSGAFELRRRGGV